MITIKDTEVLNSILTHRAHPKMVELIVWFTVRYSQTVFTCAFEARDYPSVHDEDPYRGMDVRSWVFDDPQAVVDDINNHFQYDPERPEIKTAIYHDVGRGRHIHLQVHDRTIYLGETKQNEVSL